MPCCVFRSGVLLALLMFSMTGCSYFQSAETDADDETAEFEQDEKTDKDAESDEAIGEAKPTELELKLKVGDRFPLIKVIDQQLQQGSGSGGLLTNRSLLRMMLSLEVEELRDGNTRFAVRYHTVRYGHNIAGRKVEYDSESRDRAVPTEALVYAGLKDNGFSFWIGPDNRIVELVGFQDFLQKCLRDVPPAYRDQVMRQLEGTQSEDGLANFVDDGIGLLPYSDNPRHPAVAVKEGSVWELKPRRSDGPIPMNVATRCVLKSLTDSSAEISLVGRISGGSLPVSINDGIRNLRVQVKDGRCAGVCTIDRRTGLPTHSEVNRYLEMTVKLDDGSEIQQRKDVLTTITSFLDQGDSKESAIEIGRDGHSGRLARTSGSGFEGGADRVSQAVGTSGGSDADSKSDRRSSSSSRTRGRLADRTSTR